MKFDKSKIDYSVYLVTDSRLMKRESLELAVEEAVKGGCTLVQLREKELPSLDFYNLGVKIKRVTDYYHIPLIINDRIDIALAVRAAGAHVGQEDLPAGVARRVMGSGMVLGVSCRNVEEAGAAVADGADYLGVGAVFPTGTKMDAEPVAMDVLKAVKACVQIPVVAIGGINPDTIPLLKGTGIDGVAVVSAIIAQDDIAGAAEEIKRVYDQTINQ